MSHIVDIDVLSLDREQRIRVRIVLYQARWRIDIRIWSIGDDGSEQPGKGLGVQYLERLKNAVAKAYVGALAGDLIVRPRIPEPESVD